MKKYFLLLSVFCVSANYADHYTREDLSRLRARLNEMSSTVVACIQLLESDRCTNAQSRANCERKINHFEILLDDEARLEEKLYSEKK